MTVTARLDLAIFDAADIDQVGSFYAGLTGWDVVRRDSDRFGVRTPDGQEVEFQRAPDHVGPRWPGQEHPQQFHLDLQTDDPSMEAERAVALGAVRLGDGPTWITLADPAGHPFDLCQAEDVGPVMRLFAVTIDAPDASALARFYADLTGMEITYDGPEGAFIAGGGRSLMFQQISAYNPPRWPDPAHPQQAHLDLLVDDLDAGKARALELGARWLGADGDRFSVFADPAGHPFCLIR
ncbi:VOC family protein [Plantactinospora sp. WMMB334]|uniref:VOC family protein n=1 Tax=Plantactinospora sp. WMMB334 TaxID=3404119 RepID=UPI003B93AAF2